MHIVCTCTNAAAPVLLGAWLPSGCHVAAVGSYLPNTQVRAPAPTQRARVHILPSITHTSLCDFITQLAADDVCSIIIASIKSHCDAVS